MIRSSCRIWVLLIGVVLGVSGISVGSDLQPVLVPYRAAPESPNVARTVRLNQLEKNAGASFGEWSVWRYEEGGPAIVLVHLPTGGAIYMPWSSNGWLNFRDASGQWHVLYSQGDPSPQKRDDLQIAKYLSLRPDPTLESGQFAFDRWTVTVTGNALEFVNTAAHNDRLVIHAAGSQFTHNGRSIGGAR